MPSVREFLGEEKKQKRSVAEFLSETAPVRTGTTEERIARSVEPTFPATGFEEFQPGPQVPAFILRTAPGLVPAPGASALLSAGGEAAAQFVESGEITDKEQIGIAAAFPPGAAVVGRIARGLGRTAVRLVPSFFEKAQAAAREAGEALIRSLRPAEDVAQLSKAARAAGGDLIPSSNVQRIIGEIKLPATPANPRLEAVKTTIENLKGVLTPEGKIRLDDLEAIRRDIGPLLQSKAAPSELRGLYGAIVKDLEETARAGGAGASLAREAATAFKRDLGAAKVAELFEKATQVRVVSGANVPALDVARLGKLLRDPKTNKQLTEQIGADGVKLVESFISKFRSLPPTTAYNAWTTMLAALGGGVGAVTGGTATAVGIGVISSEIIRNMALVGANPKALNQILTTVAQATRASTSTAMGSEVATGILQNKNIPIELKIEAAQGRRQ